MLQLVPVLMLSYAVPRWVTWEVWAAEPLVACTGRMYKQKVSGARSMRFECVTFGHREYFFTLEGAQKA